MIRALRFSRLRYSSLSPVTPPSNAALIQSMSELIPDWNQLESQLKPFQNHSKEELQTTQLTLERLMEAGLHLGHSTERWHKNALPYIYGRRAGIHVIDLTQTLEHLKRAMKVTKEVTKRNGNVLFVGMRPFMKNILIEAAKFSQQFYVHGHWLNGCLTNHQQVLKRADPRGILIQPDLVICLDLLNSQKCLEEVRAVRLPSIGLVDTDCDAAMVSYPIPGNDDSVASVELIAYLLASAAKEGKMEFEKSQPKSSTSATTKKFVRSKKQ